MQDARSQLLDKVRQFVETFNRRDLDAAMAHFAEDAVYDELTGARHVGKTAVRAAFVPQFRGDYGHLIFDEEDLFVDFEAQKALVSWTCRLEGKGGGWRGLDVLTFRDGLVTMKETYTKAAAPKLGRLP